jgi:dTDP-4-dehydrorhamnose reductase
MMRENPSPRPPLEMWGGVECSVVRLRRGRDDQLVRTGHHGRLEDLDRFADLGLRTLRCPVLWEHHATFPIDWHRTDAYLARLRALGIRPIVGLLHHGCGPLPGGFLDADFVSGLARFAGEVATRYPWVDAYTPVNEPLTTARFSGLYGIWHPFRKDLPTFARIFLQQAHGIREAMRAIRKVNPGAQLIQTEDLGKTHSTAPLHYQAEFENERRWLTFDLLSGTLEPDRPLYGYLKGAGISAPELDSFRQDPVHMGILGMNHYVTSERFLDGNLQNYPACYHGGNGREAFADVPAVRVRVEGAAGPARLLRELWQRYHQPVAVTEVQLACTRDEQLRWLQEVWQAARELRHEHAEVRAVTAWALLGAYDWDSLLLDANDHYESGAFIVQGSSLRPTAVAAAIRALATRGEFDHPAAAGPGWWRRPIRFAFPPISAPQTGPGTAVWQPPRPRSPLVVVGDDAVLTDAFARACESRHLFLRVEPAASVAVPCPRLNEEEPWGIIDVNRLPFAPASGSSRNFPPDPTHLSGLVDATLDRLIDSAVSA